MGSRARFNFSPAVAQQFQNVDRNHYCSQYIANQTSTCVGANLSTDWRSANVLPPTISRSLETDKPGRYVNQQNVSIPITDGNSANHNAINYSPQTLIKCSNCDSGILLCNAFKVDSSAFCDACCYSEKMKVSQILLCIFCRRLFVLSMRDAKTHGKFPICSTNCWQQFSSEYPYCCLGCGEFFHHSPFLSRLPLPYAHRVPKGFTFCSAKCHDEVENHKVCCVCGLTSYETSLGTVILPDGRVKRCCSDNGECTSTFDYCLRNTCAYCSEEPRKENPLRLKFVENMSMIFCEATCLRGYLDCRLQRPPKSVNSENLVSGQLFSESSIVRVHQNVGSSVQIGYPLQQCESVHDLTEDRIHRSVLDVAPANNCQRGTGTSVNEIQLVVPRQGSIQSSNRVTYNAPANMVSPAMEAIPSTYGSTFSGIARTTSVLASQTRSILELVNANDTMGSQSQLRGPMPLTVEDDDEDIQVINVIKESPVVATANESEQPAVTAPAASSCVPLVPTEALSLPLTVDSSEPKISNQPSQNLFEILDSPDEPQPNAQSSSQMVELASNSGDDPAQSDSLKEKDKSEVDDVTDLAKSEETSKSAQVGSRSEEEKINEELIVESETHAVSKQGTTSVISEQTCYTVASAYKDIVLQSCASEAASDLSCRNPRIGSDDSSGLKNASQLVACHACARSVATFEAYPSFCTGVQKSANHLFCSRTCRRKFQERFGVKKKCTMCSIERPVEEEIQLANGPKIVFCSTLCFHLFKEHYFRSLNLVFATCSFCGRNFSDNKDGNLVFVTATEKYRFCCNKCKDNFRQWNLMSRCDACSRNITSGEVKIFWRGKPKQFCDRKCMLTFYQQENLAVNQPYNGSETFKNSSKPQLLTQSQRNRERPTKVKRRHVAIQCHPQHANRTVQVAPRMREKGSSMETDDLPQTEDSSKPSYPLIIPVPVPIYVPVPCQLYTQPYPYPVPLPLPCALPVGLPEKVLFNKDLQSDASPENSSTDSFLIGRAIAASLIRDEEPDFRTVKLQNEEVVNDFVDKLKSMEFNFEQEFDIVFHTSENSDLPLALDAKLEFLRGVFKVDSCVDWIRMRLTQARYFAGQSNHDRSANLRTSGSKDRMKDISLKRHHKNISNFENKSFGGKNSKVAKISHCQSENEGEDDESESESESLASIQSLERSLRKTMRVNYKIMVDGADTCKLNEQKGKNVNIVSPASVCGQTIETKIHNAIKVEVKSESSDDKKLLKQAIGSEEASDKESLKNSASKQHRNEKYSSTKSLQIHSVKSDKKKCNENDSKHRKTLARIKGERSSENSSRGSKHKKQATSGMVSKSVWNSKEILCWTTKCCNCLIYTLGYIGKTALVDNLAPDNVVNRNSNRSILAIENITDSNLDQILCLFLTKTSGQKISTLGERSLNLRLLAVLFLQLFLKFFERPKILFFHRNFPFLQQALTELKISPASQDDSAKIGTLRRFACELCWICGILGDSNAHSLQFTVLYHLFENMNLRCLSQHKLLTKSHFTRSLWDTSIKKNQDEPSSTFRDTRNLEMIKFRNHGTLNFSEERQMVSDPSNPLRCPMRSYNLYLQKLPANNPFALTVSLFYKEPHITYSQNSRLWYCNSRLNEKTLSVYLTLAKFCSTTNSDL